MTIYFVFFALLLLGLLLPDERQTSRVYLIVSIILLWLLIGLRDTTVGTDTPSYVRAFLEIANIKGSTLLKDLPADREPGYTAITWLVGQFTDSYPFFLLTWALFPAAGLYCLLKNNLRTPVEYLEAYIVMCMLGLFAFFVAGIRQTAAISVVMISFKYLRESKLLKFLLCIAVAYTFHNSVVMFLLAYPLRKLKIRWWILFLFPLLFIVTANIHIDAVVKYSAMVFNERFKNYGTVYNSSQNATAFIIQIALYIIALFKLKTLTGRNRSNSLLFILATIGMVFQSMAGMLAEMSRVAFYFCVFDTVLVPRALALYNNRQLANAAFIIACLAMLLFISKSNLPLYQLSI